MKTTRQLYMQKKTEEGKKPSTSSSRRKSPLDWGSVLDRSREVLEAPRYKASPEKKARIVQDSEENDEQDKKEERVTKKEEELWFVDNTTTYRCLP